MEVTPVRMESSKASSLQWGHDKIVMEVTIYGSIRNPANSLQWGHDKIVMEVSVIDGYSVFLVRFNGAMTK